MLLGIISVAIGIASVILFAHRGSRLATLFGALYGTSIGFWLLAPLLLDGHRLRPLTICQWLIVTSAFAGGFSIYGALLAFVGVVPIGLAVLMLKQDFRNPPFAYAIGVVLWVPIAYLSISALAEWANFGRPLPAALYAAAIRPLAVWSAIILAILVLLERYYARGHRRLRARAISATFLGLTSFGMLIVPLRLKTPPPAPAGVAPGLVQSSATQNTAPLLVVGLDGGNWRTLRSAMSRGSAPTFSRLVASGIHGEIEALWPPYWSAPAWGAIMTGHSQEELGIYEDLSARVSGLPLFELPLTAEPALDALYAVELMLLRTGVIEALPTPRSALTWPPVWERLTSAGIRTAVIRFPFTYPAKGQASYVISNRAMVDLWDGFGVRKGEPDQLVEPADDFDQWSSTLANEHLGSSLFEQVLGHTSWPKPADSVIDPVDVLKRAMNTQEQMHVVTMQLLRRDPSLRAVMLHVASVDEVCHAFWQYRFPEDFPGHRMSPSDLETLGPVIDRVIEQVDHQLDALIGAFPTRPNVLIVADHGEESNTTRPPWKGWHSSPGVFVAAGPGISPRSNTLRVSYYDIVPTILDLLGFEKPPDLRGHSVAFPH
jgi:hypothetical protein